MVEGEMGAGFRVEIVRCGIDLRALRVDGLVQGGFARWRRSSVRLSRPGTDWPGRILFGIAGGADFALVGDGAFGLGAVGGGGYGAEIGDR